MRLLYELIAKNVLLQAVLAGAVLFGGYRIWQARERSIGAQAVTQVIEKKADDNAKKADEVRSDVAIGKSGPRVRAKYERTD